MKRVSSLAKQKIIGTLAFLERPRLAGTEDKEIEVGSSTPDYTDKQWEADLRECLASMPSE